MSKLINADELKSKFLEMGCMDGKPCYGAEIIDRIPTVKAVPISENATNGDVIQAVFTDDLWLHIHARRAKKEWWNAPYKGSDTE